MRALIGSSDMIYVLGYSPPDKIFKMAARFATVTEEEIRQMNEEASQTQNPPVWLILKQLSPSVSVPSEKYSPCCFAAQ